jgi:hypothetical protein
VKDLVKNPIGIIALFISLIYGFANLLLGTTAGALTSEERFPLIIFIVLFPVVVLAIFYLLVSRHHGKLYAPGDYKDDKSFLRTLSKEEREQKLEKEAQEALPTPTTEVVPRTSAVTNPFSGETIAAIRNELQLIESLVIRKLETEFRQSAERDVGVGDTGVSFDAMFTSSGKVTFLEVKTLRHPNTIHLMVDRILYNAMVVDRFMKSNFKLLLVVVYQFNKDELPRVENSWRKRIEKCPAAIELRFIQRDELDA